MADLPQRRGSLRVIQLFDLLLPAPHDKAAIYKGSYDLMSANQIHRFGTQV